MTKKRTKTAYTLETKLAAVQDLTAGKMKTREVLQKHGINSAAALHRWREQHEAGELKASPGAANGKAAAKLNGHDAGADASTGMTPEAMFQSRVHEAIVLLRQGEREVERLKQQRKIKEPDTAHLYAQLALRKLQGDNGR